MVFDNNVLAGKGGVGTSRPFTVALELDSRLIFIGFQITCKGGNNKNCRVNAMGKMYSYYMIHVGLL